MMLLSRYDSEEANCLVFSKCEGFAFLRKEKSLNMISFRVFLRTLTSFGSMYSQVFCRFGKKTSTRKTIPSLPIPPQTLSLHMSSWFSFIICMYSPLTQSCQHFLSRSFLQGVCRCASAHSELFSLSAVTIGNTASL